MAENTKGQNRGNENRSQTEENDRMSQGRSSTDQNISQSKDEKSSSMGRNVKNTGISTKDGLTGSDYDGQVSDGR